ncbi:hypothetical protein AOLI_G00171890 [Acnodon oligacanthus]
MAANTQTPACGHVHKVKAACGCVRSVKGTERPSPSVTQLSFHLLSTPALTACLHLTKYKLHTIIFGSRTACTGEEPALSTAGQTEGQTARGERESGPDVDHHRKEGQKSHLIIHQDKSRDGCVCLVHGGTAGPRCCVTRPRGRSEDLEDAVVLGGLAWCGCVHGQRLPEDDCSRSQATGVHSISTPAHSHQALALG